MARGDAPSVISLLLVGWARSCLHLGPTQLLDEASQGLGHVLKAAGFGSWRDRTKAIYAQEVQSWHRRIHCILVPAAEVALWPQWLLGFANSHPATSETVPLGSFPCNCLPAPQIQVCIQMPPRRITRGAEGRTAKGAVSFCGSVVFLSCPQGIRDPSSAWEGVCKIKSSAAKAGNAMET